MKVVSTKYTAVAASLIGAVLLAGSVSGQEDGAARHRIPAGTPVKVKLLQNLSSEDASVGDTVRARVAGDDSSGLPVGTVFVGRVTSVTPATPKRPGVLNVKFGTRSPEGSGSFPTDMASLHLTGSTARSEKAGDTSIGAGAGGLLGFVRKRKLGDALAGAALGALGGYAVDQAQKRPASDVSLKKGSEISIHLDRSLSLRTEIDAY